MIQHILAGHSERYKRGVVALATGRAGVDRKKGHNAQIASLRALTTLDRDGIGSTYEEWKPR